MKTGKTILCITLCLMLGFVCVSCGAGGIDQATVDETHQLMIGQTFKGTYQYGGKTSSYSSTCEFTVTIVDDSYLTVQYVDKAYSYGYLTETKRGTNTDVPYTITRSSDHTQILFNWGGEFGHDPYMYDKDWTYHSVDPFVVTVEGETITLYTENYNSGHVLRMTNK